MKTRRAKLSFDIADTNMRLDMHNAGISIPLNKKEDPKKQLEQFGFFGSSSDSNKFYPGLDVNSDVIPQESDFVRVPFRLLTATIVGAGTWKATDFSNESVLRGSMNDLNKKPVYKDHETDIDNWVGIVDGVTWEGSKNGVPAGINGVISIDAVVAPKIARGVLQNIIFSNSVTVEFEWTPSHTFSESYEFENRIGTLHEDGTMVRRVVTEIKNYHESSLVWLGADPYAKMIDGDGNLIHIDKSAVQLTKDEQKTKLEKKRAYAIGFSMPKEVLGLSKGKSSTSNLNKTKTMLEQFVRNLLGLGADVAITQEHLNKLALKSSVLSDEDKNKLTSFGKIKGFNAKGEEATIDYAAATEVVALTKADHTAVIAEVTQLKADKAQLVTDKATLTGKVTELTAEAAVGADFLKLKREETTRLYGIFTEGKTDESVLNLIESCSPEQLDGMLKMYTKGMTTKFSVTVKNEETGEFEFRSSFATPKVDDGEQSTAEFEVTHQDLHEKFSSNSMNIIGAKG